MNSPLRIADGGYLVWCYGPDMTRWDSWNSLFYQEYILVMDHPNLHRKEYYDDYKIDRSERREKDPKKMARFQAVMAFKAQLENDEKLDLYRYPGLEADDLIALLSWAHPGLHLLGVDKDLLQLGSNIFTMQRLDGTVVTLYDYIKKLPLAVARQVKVTPQLVPLLLALMGDKSDSIPRMVPSRDFEPLVKVLKDERPYNAAVQEYGGDVLRNLMLTTLPYPGLFGIEKEDLPDLWDREEWNREELWSRLEPDLVLSVSTKGDKSYARTLRLPGGDVGRREEDLSSQSKSRGTQEWW